MASVCAAPMVKRVRVLVAIDHEGKWSSAGYDYGDGSGSDPKEWLIIDGLSEHMSYHWVEADVPVPSESIVVGRVADGDQ